MNTHYYSNLWLIWLYPFGMNMPGRNFSSEEYRFGFNTQEKTDEISGLGNHTTALYWEYDTRLGRRWNIDPKYKLFPNESPYLVNHGNPIWYFDILGDVGKAEKEAKKIKKAEDKFNKKVVEPLREMERNNVTPDKIQAEANKLADKYQNTKWLHRFVSKDGPAINKKSHKASDISWKIENKQPISEAL